MTYTNTEQISSGSTVLEGSPESVSQIAIKGLRDLGVNIKFHTRVIDTRESPGKEQEITLSDGSKVLADLYIPTYGLIPNSSYLSETFLDAKGFIVVDEYLKVKGTTDVWAIGDVSNVEYSQFLNCDRQSAYAAKAIASILGTNTNTRKPVQPYKAFTSRKLTPFCLLSMFETRSFSLTLCTWAQDLWASRSARTQVPVTLGHGSSRHS